MEFICSISMTYRTQSIRLNNIKYNLLMEDKYGIDYFHIMIYNYIFPRMTWLSTVDRNHPDQRTLIGKCLINSRFLIFIITADCKLMQSTFRCTISDILTFEIRHNVEHEYPSFYAHQMIYSNSEYGIIMLKTYFVLWFMKVRSIDYKYHLILIKADNAPFYYPF